MNGRVVFVLSENYSGSTVLGLVLGSHSRAAFLGEPAQIARRTKSGAFRHEAGFCALCTSTAAACPTWTPDVIGRVRADPSRAFDVFGDMFPSSDVLVDASKTLWWISTLGDAGLDRVVVHISKPIEGFVASELSRRAKDGRASSVRTLPAHLASKWVATNRAIRRFALQEGIPYRHVRYDDFARDPLATLDALGPLLGYTPEPSQCEFWRFPHHYVKGNPGVRSHFNIELAGSESTVNRELHETNHQSIFVDDKWKTVLTPARIRRLYAYGPVARMSQELGHEPPVDLGSPPASHRVRATIAYAVVSGSSRLGGSPANRTPTG